MAKTITTTQLLDFLVKAGRVASRVEVRKQVQGMYQIGIHCDWGDENIFYTQTTCISEDGHSTCKGRKYEFEFSAMDSMLDELVNNKEKRETEDQSVKN